MSPLEDFANTANEGHLKAVRRCFTRWLLSECEGAEVDENAKAKKEVEKYHVYQRGRLGEIFV